MENAQGLVFCGGSLSNAEGSTGDLVEVECNGIAMLNLVLQVVPCHGSECIPEGLSY